MLFNDGIVTFEQLCWLWYFNRWAHLENVIVLCNDEIVKYVLMILIVVCIAAGTNVSIISLTRVKVLK